MELSQQQLSKQDHYDYGLRSFVIPISRAAGAMKRTDPDAPEEVGFLMEQSNLQIIGYLFVKHVHFALDYIDRIYLGRVTVWSRSATKEQHWQPKRSSFAHLRPAFR